MLVNERMDSAFLKGWSANILLLQIELPPPFPKVKSQRLDFLPISQVLKRFESDSAHLPLKYRIAMLSSEETHTHTPHSQVSASDVKPAVHEPTQKVEMS